MPSKERDQDLEFAKNEFHFLSQFGIPTHVLFRGKANAKVFQNLLGLLHQPGVPLGVLQDIRDGCPKILPNVGRGVRLHWFWGPAKP